MAKRKYYYAIVEKENGNFFLDSGRLPIFYNKQVAKDVLEDYGNEMGKYIIHPLPMNIIEKVILGHKQII